jgi:hypothetical protein
MTISQKYKYFAKEKFARIVVTKNNVNNGYEVEYGDDET